MQTHNNVVVPDDDGKTGPGSQNKERRLSRLSMVLDQGNKGYLTPLEQTLRKYDKNNDGCYGVDEVRHIVEDLDVARDKQQRAEEQSRFLKMGIGFLGLLVVILSIAVLGVTFAANEMSKENHVNAGGVLVTKSGDASVATASVITKSGILGIPTIDTKMVESLEELTLAVASGPNAQLEQVIMRVAGVHRAAANSTATVWSVLQGERLEIDRIKAAYYFNTASGGKAGASKCSDATGGCAVAVPVKEQRRRLTEMEAEETLAKQRLLSFQGSLSTSGSFTMAATTGFN
eukprot:g6308.t1